MDRPWGKAVAYPPSTHALPFHTPPWHELANPGEATRLLTPLDHPVVARERYFLQPVLAPVPDHFASTPGGRPHLTLWPALPAPSCRPHPQAALPGPLPENLAL